MKSKSCSFSKMVCKRYGLMLGDSANSDNFTFPLLILLGESPLSHCVLRLVTAKGSARGGAGLWPAVMDTAQSWLCWPRLEEFSSTEWKAKL